MRKTIIRAGVGLALIASGAIAVAGGFLWGFSYSSARDSSFSAFVEASALRHIREGNVEEGTGILESRIDMNISSHFHSVWAEELLPEVWIFKRTSHGGLGFVSSYRAENPLGERTNDLAESVLACYRAPDLPSDPESNAYREAILECYERLR